MVGADVFPFESFDSFAFSSGFAFLRNGTSSACFSDLPGLRLASSGLSDAAGTGGSSGVASFSGVRISFSTFFVSVGMSFSVVMGGAVSVFSEGVLRTL